jgi:hypothetical protein
MYGIFTYIYPKNDTNVGKYSIHGASGYDQNFLPRKFSTFPDFEIDTRRVYRFAVVEQTIYLEESNSLKGGGSNQD